MTFFGSLFSALLAAVGGGCWMLAVCLCDFGCVNGALWVSDCVLSASPHHFISSLTNHSFICRWISKQVGHTVSFHKQVFPTYTQYGCFMRAVLPSFVEKFTVPPGAYVRTADYYWSFNEFVDGGASQIFQNTGEYSYGFFNARHVLPVQLKLLSIFGFDFLTWITFNQTMFGKTAYMVNNFN